MVAARTEDLAWVWSVLYAGLQTLRLIISNIQLADTFQKLNFLNYLKVRQKFE